jgi:hypothetical protein
MPGLLSGLQNLAVFDNVPDSERDRALIQAGLGMMQPQNEAVGGGPLTQLTGGIQAGLSSLDRSEDRRFAEEQRQSDNLISGRAATVGERRAGTGENLALVADKNADTSLFSAESADTIGTQNAETNATNATNALALGTEQNVIAGQNADTSAQNATTGQEQLAEAARQFDAQLGNRFASKTLDIAKAEYYRRMPEARGGSVSEATITDMHIKAKILGLLAADRLKGVNAQYSGADDPVLIDQAITEVIMLKGQAGTDLGLITQTGDGQAVGERNTNIAAPGLAGLRNDLGFSKTPELDVNAEAAMQFTPERWQAIVSGDVSEADAAMIDQLLDNYPAVRRAAAAAFQTTGQ